MTHPLLETNKRLRFYAGIWLLVAVMHAFSLAKFQNVAWPMAILDSFTFSLIYGLLSTFLWYTCKYLSAANVRFIRVIENHAFAAAVTSAIWVGLGYFLIIHVFSVSGPYAEFFRSSLIWRGMLGILYYFIIVSFYHLYILTVKLQERASNEAELKTLVKEAELRSLKFQVNPHFIFNSLNSINSLTMTDPEKAGEMTVKLGDFLRYTLSKGEEQTSRLKEELDSMRLYLEIEKVRFGDKIEYHENAAEDCNELVVPSMILQPLFENAVKHGVYESVEPVNICLNCERNGSFMKLSLTNSFDPEAVSPKGEGIGLRNVKGRLERMYNHTNLLDIEKLHDTFCVTIFLPTQEALN